MWHVATTHHFHLPLSLAFKTKIHSFIKFIKTAETVDKIKSVLRDTRYIYIYNILYVCMYMYVGMYVLYIDFVTYFRGPLDICYLLHVFLHRFCHMFSWSLGVLLHVFWHRFSHIYSKLTF